MNRSAISLIIWSIVLILAQVLVFNHICLFGYAVAFVFIYTLIKLPISMSKEWQFTIAFLLGLVIDIFSDTLGMNTLACTILMAVRRPVIRLYVTRDDELTDTYPGYNSFGTFSFIKYVLTLTLLYCGMFSNRIFILRPIHKKPIPNFSKYGAHRVAYSWNRQLNFPKK